MSETKDIIANLKEIRKFHKCSYQDIVNMTAAIGQPVSLSTVKRVFSKDSEQYDFRYDTTIQPIATVLLGIGQEEIIDTDIKKINPKEENARITALKKIIEIKNQLLDEKTNEIELLRKEFKRKNRLERWLIVALIILIVGIVSIILIDFAIPSVGWYRE